MDRDSLIGSACGRGAGRPNESILESGRRDDVGCSVDTLPENRDGGVKEVKKGEGLSPEAPVVLP